MIVCKTKHSIHSNCTIRTSHMTIGGWPLGQVHTHQYIDRFLIASLPFRTFSLWFFCLLVGAYKTTMTKTATKWWVDITAVAIYCTVDKTQQSSSNNGAVLSSSEIVYMVFVLETCNQAGFRYKMSWVHFNEVNCATDQQKCLNLPTSALVTSTVDTHTSITCFVHIVCSETNTPQQQALYGSCANMHENHKHIIIIMPTASALITVSNITTERLSVTVQLGNCALIGLVWVLNNSVLPTCIACM